MIFKCYKNWLIKFSYSILFDRKTILGTGTFSCEKNGLKGSRIFSGHKPVTLINNRGKKKIPVVDEFMILPIKYILSKIMSFDVLQTLVWQDQLEESARYASMFTGRTANQYPNTYS